MSDLMERLRAALAGRYELEHTLGEGGMATVYLARDVKHDRQVAVKVLKPELAAVIGADRFLHEIKITAQLQHPHILPLFDSGQADSFLYYVMPYVNGESLRDKLEREKQLPVDDAVRIASEIADALGYAHGHDVIHRDVKPANILLHEERVLVADFGIALAVSVAGADRLTQTGISVGTPRYMSPEQGTGDRELDGRSDIYSLGCIVYEMLAGDTPHTGPTNQIVFAKVLSEEPRPLHELRASVPPNVEAAVHRALQKLPADRWPDAQAFRACLGGTGEYRSSPALAAAGRPARRDLFVGTLTVAALAVGVLASNSWSKAPADGGLAAESAVRWLDLVLPDSAPMAFQGRAWQELRSLDLSRNGESLVYVAEGDGGGTRLYLRRLDEPGFRPIAGTEGAYGPFFSPDGRTVGFFAEDQLRTVSIDDGSVVALGDVRNPAGAVWTDDEILVSEGGLVRFAAASGGREATAAACVEEARPCLLPDPVPGTDWVLVSSYEDIAVVSLETGERRTLLDGLFEPQARLLPDGDIAYFHRPGQLFVVRFDSESLEVTGEPVPALDGIRQGSFGSQLDVSNDGTLVYAPGGHFTDSRFTWVSRDGHETALPYEPASFGTFALSPDGRSLATTVYRTNAQVWVYDLGRAQPVPLVTDGDAQHPVWSPDGREIAYMAGAGGGAAPSILAIPVSGGSGSRLLIRDGGYPFSWSRGGDVSYARPGGATKSDVWVGSVATGEASAVFASAAADDAPTLSPDGRWIAYMSAVTGRWEVYVEPHPATGERWTLSEGGEFPRWSSDGTALYYVRGGEMFELDLTRGPAAAGAPRRLFEGPYVQTFGHAFDIAPDGQRFLMLKASDPRSSSAHLTVVEGWMTEVARRLADR